MKNEILGYANPKIDDEVITDVWLYIIHYENTLNHSENLEPGGHAVPPQEPYVLAGCKNC
jgi:hypothetical protein